MPSICLCMIVKNERHVMERLIAQVAPHISTWVICDTGSSDGTQDLVRATFGRLQIAGALHERPWRDFGHNRTEALALARGSADYIWMIDADDVIHGDLQFHNLQADCYELRYGGDLSYWRPQVFRDGLPWRYEGVLHEFPTCDEPYVTARLDGAYSITSGRTGARNQDPLKYHKDAALLEDAVKREPDNSRYWYYLGQSWMDAGEPGRALPAFRRRVELGGWAEETYAAQLRVGRCLIWTGATPGEVTEALLWARQLRAERAESLYELARYYRVRQGYEAATLFAREAACTPFPVADRLFVEPAVYHHKALEELAVSAYYTTHWRHEGHAACRRLLALPDLPDEVRSRMKEALRFYEAA